MEIALSSFTQQYDSTAFVESARQRQQQDAQRQTSAGNNRAQDNQARDAQNQNAQARAENIQRTQPNAQSARATTRIINGEVLASETQRVSPRESERGARSDLFSGSSTNQQPSGQPDSRRISAQQAIQTFQENEDLVPANNQQRQVSGIIDTFV